jgi:hypothetical protein
MEFVGPFQRIYYRHELPIAEYLMSFQQALREEFLGNASSLEQIAKHITPTINNLPLPSDSKNYMVQNNESKPDISLWRALGFKYEYTDMGISWKETNEEFISRYPTAFKLINEYGNDCPIANYSLLGPNSKINRHTGGENRTGEFIRIHIPLIIPEGSAYFEVLDEVVTWNDIFAFNNQFVHSAHNNTSEWRLVFLLDIRRTRAGLPPGVSYDQLSQFEEFDMVTGQYLK